MKPSFSYPDLKVTPDGRVFKDGKELKQTHATTQARGPVVTIKINDKHRQIAVQTLVYEAYIKGSKRLAGERIVMIDGNDFNCAANNIKKADPGTPIERSDRNLVGLNGIDEIYMW